MAWNGTGTYTRTNGTNSGANTWADDAAASTKIRADRHDLHDEDIATAINNCITQDNQSKPTSDFLPNVDASYDLGSSSKQWVDGYFSGGIISSGVPRQRVYTQDAAVATTTTVMPFDDSIPQNTEGGEFMTLAITPTSASNILEIEVIGFFSHSSTGAWTSIALFQDSTAGALAAQATYENIASGTSVATFKHTMVSGTASATTFKVRAGGQNAGTLTFNGESAAGRFGGVMASSIIITEYQV